MTEAFAPSQEISRISVLDAIVNEQRIQIAELTNNLAVARQYSTTRLALIDTLYEKIHKAETLVLDWADNDNIEEENLAELSAIFDWDVTKEIEVTVTAVFKGTISVPRSFDTDYLDDSFSVSCEASGSDIEGYLDCDEISVEVEN